jgi:hypothetical protein
MLEGQVFGVHKGFLECTIRQKNTIAHRREYVAQWFGSLQLDTVSIVNEVEDGT